MQEGNWEGAMAAYQEALKDDPFSPTIQAKLNAAKGRVAAAYQERGRAALKERNVLQAIEAFKRALSLEPSNQEHQSALAQALRFKEAQDRLAVGQKMLKGGRLDDAAEAFERALELDPDLKASTASSSRPRSEEHTSELQSPMYLVRRLLLEKKKTQNNQR